MIDMQTVKDAYQHFEITNIPLDRLTYNIFNGLTKTKSNSVIIKLLQNGKFN